MLHDFEVNKFKEYLTLLKDGNAHQIFIDNIQEVIDSHETIQIYPVCVVSYHRSKRSALLTEAIEEGFINQVTVYCYDREADDYKDCPNKVLVPWSFREMPGYPLARKREFIVNDQRKKNIKQIFMLDDDAYNPKLPYPSKTGNEYFDITLNMLFHLWTHMIDKYKLDLSGYTRAWEVASINLTKENIFVKNRGAFQAVHVNIDFDDNINYDPFAGWEDFDLQLAYTIKGANVVNIPLVFDNAGSNDSVLEYRTTDPISTLNRTIGTFEKWGSKLIKPDGAYDIQVAYRWNVINNSTPQELQVLASPLVLTENHRKCILYIWKSVLSWEKKKMLYELAFDDECMEFSFFKKFVDKIIYYERKDLPKCFLKKSLAYSERNRLGIHGNEDFPPEIAEQREKLFETRKKKQNTKKCSVKSK